MPDLPDFFSRVGPHSFSKVMERRKIESPHQGMCFCNPNKFSHVAEKNHKKVKILMGTFNFSMCLQIRKKIVDKPLKKMPDLPDFFSRVCPHSDSKVMERRKVENPHQVMCFLQPQQVFLRGREKTQKN